MYRRMLDGQGWPGEPLQDTNGHPLTHDILNRLGALKNADGSASPDSFEDDFDSLQRRLLSDAAQWHQHDSPESDSEHNAHHSPPKAAPVRFHDPFAKNAAPLSAPATPPDQSPFPAHIQILSPSKPHDSESDQRSPASAQSQRWLHLSSFNHPAVTPSAQPSDLLQQPFETWDFDDPSMFRLGFGTQPSSLAPTHDWNDISASDNSWTGNADLDFTAFLRDTV